MYASTGNDPEERQESVWGLDRTTPENLLNSPKRLVHRLCTQILVAMHGIKIFDNVTKSEIGTIQLTPSSNQSYSRGSRELEFSKIKWSG